MIAAMLTLPDTNPIINAFSVAAAYSDCSYSESGS